jgi:L-fuconolactonase
MTTCTRRQFLERAVAAAALGPMTRGIKTSPVGPAIDTHTHFYDPRRPTGVPWPPESDPLLYLPHYPSDFQKLAEKTGVVGTVVVEASPWVEDNQWILDLAKAYPIIVGFIGNLRIGEPEFAANLGRFGIDPLFRGLRIGARALARGLDQQPFETDIGRLQERGYTLDLLGGANMLPDVVRLAQRAPELRLVIDHLPFANWVGNPSAAREALEPVAQQPNVYAKVSNVVQRVEDAVVREREFYKPVLDVLWHLFGPGRVIYGSNWPVSNRIAPYAVIFETVADYVAGLGNAEAERYFWRNSLAAYDWLPRGAAAKLIDEAR